MKKALWLTLVLALFCAAALADGTWICKTCGRENDSNFCPKCGTKRPEEKIVCPNCGKEYSPADEYAFCPDCGASLTADAGEETPKEETADAEKAPSFLPLTITAEECESVYREAVLGTAQMLARSITYCDSRADDPAEQARRPYASLKQRFLDVDFGKPQAMAILEFSEEQFRNLCDALSCDGTRLAAALNEKINREFSREYTDAAGQAAYSRDTTRKLKLETQSCVAALLVYESDIGLVLIHGKNEQGALFLSGKPVLDSFGEQYLRELFAGLGLSDVRCALYGSPEAVEALRTTTSFQNPGYSFVGVVPVLVSSEDALLSVLPRLYSCGLFTPDYIMSECTAYYLNEHDEDPEDGLRAARFVSEKLDEAVKWLEPEGRNWHAKRQITRYADWPDAPEFVLPEDFSSLTVNPLKEGDRVVVLSRSDRDEKKRTLLRLDAECALPAEWIPESFTDADYFVLVSTHWEENGVKNGITVHNAVSEILLYDAKTLEPVYRIGSQNDGLEGFGNVATSKDFYQSVRYYRIIAKIWDKLL